MSWPDVLHFILYPVSGLADRLFRDRLFQHNCKLNSHIYIATFVAVACTNFLLRFVRAVSSLAAECITFSDGSRRSMTVSALTLRHSSMLYICRRRSVVMRKTCLRRETQERSTFRARDSLPRTITRPPRIYFALR